MVTRLEEVPLARIGVGEDALDGPFILSSGERGLLVSLRGKDGGAMPSAAEIHWRRAMPPAFETGELHVFLRRADSAFDLGRGRVTRRGKLVVDGFALVITLESPLDDPSWRTFVEQANAPLAPPAEEAIAALGATSTTDERMAALRVFIERWWGGPLGTVVPERLAAAPRPLRDLHTWIAGRGLAVQNQILAFDGHGDAVHDDDGEDTEDEDAGDDECAHAGKLVFYVENQGVCTWATEREGDDPPVYVRGTEDDARWQLEAPKLSAFLIQMLVMEATLGAPCSASRHAIDARGLRELAKHVAALPLPDWATSSTRFFGSGGIVGFAASEGEEFSVWLGATEGLRFEPIAHVVESWDCVAF